MPGPWSVKGIDEETREVARAAAQAAGIPIGQWIDRAIQRAAARPDLRPPAAAPRNGHAVALPASDPTPPPARPEPAAGPDEAAAPAMEPPAADVAPTPQPEAPAAGAATAPAATAPGESAAAAPPEVEQPQLSGPADATPDVAAEPAAAVERPAPEPAPPPASSLPQLRETVPAAEPQDETARQEPATLVRLAPGSAAAAASLRHQAMVAADPLVPRRRRRSSHILAKIGLGLATGLVIGTLVAWLTGGAPWSSDRAAADRAVARIQVLLTELHFDPGPADGVMRPQTADAIARFQQVAGMPVDGRPGSAVLAELEAIAGPARGSGR
ncbi:MAG: peptidoglycan-binding domain-containing protein [Rhodospirillaceae bacterium]